MLLRTSTVSQDIVNFYKANRVTVLVHNGYTDKDALLHDSGIDFGNITNIFAGNRYSQSYLEHFSQYKRILLRDGFNRRVRNADYPEFEYFSDIHLTFNSMKLDGYGDYLMVGDTYSVTGGQAHAVAIHLTFIDPNQDNAMYIYHFVSDRRDTPSDPAGKFFEALQKLIDKLESGTSHLDETSAISEFRNLHSQKRNPGLGYVKKLSMKHHIETLSNWHNNTHPNPSA